MKINSVNMTCSVDSRSASTALIELNAVNRNNTTQVCRFDSFPGFCRVLHSDRRFSGQFEVVTDKK